MKRTLAMIMLISTAIAAVTLAAGPSTQPASPTRRHWSHYDVVVDRNIFSRQHGRDAGNSSTPRTPPPVATGQGWALSGTAIMGEERTAFLENAGNGSTVRVHEGDTTDSGRVTKIDTDHIELDTGGRAVSVPIGVMLDGSVRIATTQPSASGTDPSTTAPTSSDENAVLQRLRARRQQEMGGRP